jgi:hypothetical protein
METHVKVLGILNIVSGAMGLCGALVLMLVFGGAAGVVAADGDADAAIALPIIGLTGFALVMFAVIVSLPAVIIGYGLLRFRSWARIAGIVLSIVSLIVFPFGTLLGVYGLWVLFSKDAERLFGGVQATRV